ncbi:hypothetical protein IE53DRAFT_8381 [Violaceomyces palustris]|uniref:Uncharacterized protein n=1 Tax=Violaceomyces palustris TaxID=1673888 RepID=A0ACD0P2G8_9BASI|nr:hypothetical protein IE53DRAFT_8381 [Violaceomyces palustris]
MTSYQKLRELALQKTNESQAALALERSAKEREVAAKRAAQEAKEREQRERERKLVAARIAQREKEEQEWKARKEASVKEAQEIATDVAKQMQHLPSTSSNSTKLSSTKKGSNLLASRKSSSSSSSSRSRVKTKSKADEDDFTGNRADRILKRSSNSTSKDKRAPVALTREEKKQRKLAREFGTIPRFIQARAVGSVNPGNGIGKGSSTASYSSQNGSHPKVISAKAALLKDERIVLGGKRVEHKSIDEVEREIRARKINGNADKMETLRLEKEAAELRRKRAMEERKRLGREGKTTSTANQSEKDDDDDDDLFGSEDEKKKGGRSSSSRSPEKPKLSPKPAIDRDRSRDGNKPDYSIPRIKADQMRERDSTSPSNRSMSFGGINPADFLPNAPLRPETIARLPQKMKASSPALKGSTSSALKRGGSPVGEKGTKKIRSDQVAKDTPSPAGNSTPKRETERERFIREEAARKEAKRRESEAGGKANVKVQVLSAKKDPSGARRRRVDEDDEDDDEEIDEEEYDTYDDYDDDEEDGAGSNIRDQIWSMFGKDRRA